MTIRHPSSPEFSENPRNPEGLFNIDELRADSIQEARFRLIAEVGDMNQRNDHIRFFSVTLNPANAQPYYRYKISDAPISLVVNDIISFDIMVPAEDLGDGVEMDDPAIDFNSDHILFRRNVGARHGELFELSSNGIRPAMEELREDNEEDEEDVENDDSNEEDDLGFEKTTLLEFLTALRPETEQTHYVYPVGEKEGDVHPDDFETLGELVFPGDDDPDPFPHAA